MTFRGKLMAILMGVLFLSVGMVVNSCGNQQDLSAVLHEMDQADR